MARKTPEATDICKYCGGYIHPGADGGRVRIPTAISGLPEHDVEVHNKCLNDLIAQYEQNRKPITPTTVFQAPKGERTMRRYG